jgi:hypothetical protein
MPIEFHQGRWQARRRGSPNQVWKNPRLLVYWDFKIDQNLTLQELNVLIKASRLQRTAVTEEVSHFLTYRYGKEPMLVFDKDMPNKIFTTVDSFKQHGEGECMQQASIFLRMLRGSKKQQEARPSLRLKRSYADFTAISVTFNPSRIGRTPEERGIIHRAECYLFGDNLDKKMNSLKSTFQQ